MESDGEAVPPPPVLKHDRRVVKEVFGTLLEATGEDWEEHEKAKLAALMQSLMCLRERKFVKWLHKYTDPTAELYACLGDAGLPLQTRSIVQLLSSGTPDRIMKVVEECLEGGILDVACDEDLSAVRVVALCSTATIIAYE